MMIKNKKNDSEDQQSLKPKSVSTVVATQTKKQVLLRTCLLSTADDTSVTKSNM